MQNDHPEDVKYRLRDMGREIYKSDGMYVKTFKEAWKEVMTLKIL